ncbi:MAG: response regulator transcription factor [Bacteroidota bacterium]
MIHLLIADDHFLFRETLRRDLTSEPDMLVAGVAATGHEVLESLNHTLIDIILLDVKLESNPLEGLEICSMIQDQFPATEVILLTVHVDKDLESRAQKAGAAGIISKATDQETLLNAIRRVYRGANWIPLDQTSYIFEPSQERSVLPPLAFTMTERKVLRLLSQGCSISQIAQSLNHRLHTIEVHRRNLLAKFGVFKDAELLIAAANEGLLDEWVEDE